MMFYETRNGEQEANNSYKDHASYKVIGLVHKFKLHTVFKQNLSDQASLECLKANPDHKSCGLGL